MMKLIACIALCALGLVAPSPGQNIPEELQGKWIVKRTLHTRTISCWGDKESKALLGTEIEYSSEIFRWKDLVTKNPVATVRVLSAQQFHDENSGGSSNGSQVTFEELGIAAKEATSVVVAHGDAHVADATTEIPGDSVLIRDKNTIVFSVCNVYFEARRAASKHSTPSARK